MTTPMNRRTIGGGLLPSEQASTIVGPMVDQVVTPNPEEMTPAQWLPIMTRRADLDWARVELLHNYGTGNAPLPELSANTKEAWAKFQRESRTNWGGIIVEAVVNRLIPNGILVGGDNSSDVAKRAQRIWRDNRMDQVFRDWVRYGLRYRYGYLTIWKGGDGNAIVTADSPRSMRVATDPLQPWKVRAAVRWWRDLDLQEDRCIVWGSNSWQMFRRKILSKDAATINEYLPIRLMGQWDPIGDETTTAAPPPVIVYSNPGLAGEYEEHLDLINRINRGILERLTTSALQAFRQRAVKGNLPETDSQGNRIDWGAVFEPAPGIVWNLPADVDMWESTPTELTGMLSASKDDIRQLSSVTRTPVPMMIPDAANQTAEGAQQGNDGHIFKCAERLTEAQAGVQLAIQMAIETEGIAMGGDMPVEVLFKPVDRVTMAEMYLAAYNASQAGESWPSIARNILGYSPEQIAQDNVDRAQQAMLQAAFQPPQLPGAQPGQFGAQQPAQGQQDGTVTPIRPPRQRAAIPPRPQRDEPSNG